VCGTWLETITADADRTPPGWEELVNHYRFQGVLDTDVDPPHKDDDWLDDAGRKARRSDKTRRRQRKYLAAKPVEPAHDAAAHQPHTQAPVPPNEPPVPLLEVPEVPQPNTPWEPNPYDEEPPVPVQAAEPATNEVPPAPMAKDSKDWWSRDLGSCRNAPMYSRVSLLPLIFYFCFPSCL
jgi:hypothetical protein